MASKKKAKKSQKQSQKQSKKKSAEPTPEQEAAAQELLSVPAMLKAITLTLDKQNVVLQQIDEQMKQLLPHFQAEKVDLPPAGTT